MYKNPYFMLIAVVAALAVVLGVNAAVATAASDGSNVIITQVIYDPAGSESGGEAVELYNPAASSVNLSGWVLATETSPTDATIPQGSIICSGCYYLVADANWSSAKDNSSWPNADYEEPMTMANADAGVALKNSNGTIVDAVGWGNPASIGAGLFEGVPHSGASIGNSLARKTANGSYVDTGNNLNDFVDATPGFRNSSSHSSAANANAEIGITIIVGGSGPVISSLAVLTDDDRFLAGSQVSPFPGSNRTVNVEATVMDSNGFSDIAAITLAFNSASFTMARKAEINSTAAVYSASFSLSSSFPAGNYTVTATAADSSGLVSGSSANFEYLTMVAIEVDTTSLVLNAAPGLTYEAIGDKSGSTAANITVSNSGNVVLDFDVSSTNFTSGSGVIAAPRLQYTFNGNYSDAIFAGNMSNTKARRDVNLSPAAALGLSLKLNVPLATSPGNYSGKISLVAVNS